MASCKRSGNAVISINARSGDFVRNFAAGLVDQLVVNAIVTIARGMGKKNVAEFVESADMSRLLRDSGVDYGQGYYLGRPRPVEEVLFNSSSS